MTSQNEPSGVAATQARPAQSGHARILANIVVVVGIVLGLIAFVVDAWISYPTDHGIDESRLHSLMIGALVSVTLASACSLVAIARGRRWRVAAIAGALAAGVFATMVAVVPQVTIEVSYSMLGLAIAFIVVGNALRVPVSRVPDPGTV